MQVVITTNKERVLSQRKMEARFGTHAVVGYSAVLDSREHASFDAYYAAVQALWQQEWRRVYAAKAHECVRLPRSELTRKALTFRVSPGRHAAINAYAYFATGLFLCVMGATTMLAHRALVGVGALRAPGGTEGMGGRGFDSHLVLWVFVVLTCAAASRFLPGLSPFSATHE